jgi:hypothetical protein
LRFFSGFDEREQVGRRSGKQLVASGKQCTNT